MSILDSSPGCTTVEPKPEDAAEAKNTPFKTTTLADMNKEPVMNMIRNDLFPGDGIPTRLPHFHLKGGALWFLISRRPYASLNAEEQAVWTAMDGTASVQNLRARFTASFEGILRRFVDLSVCAVIPGCFPANRRRVVVLEPHMDDAALSVGGTMWLRRNDCEFSLVTLAGISNFTTYHMLGRDYFDVKTVSGLRRAESSLVARLLGGRHIALELLEAPLRYRNDRWTLDWFQQHRKAIAGFMHRSAGPAEFKEWTSAVTQAVAALQPQELWIPLGVGAHADHQLARHACLQMMMSSSQLQKQCIIKFYQDVPYALTFPLHTRDLVRTLEDEGVGLEEERSDISEVMASKMRLISMFSSQFKPELVRNLVEANARRAAAGLCQYAEMLYRVTSPPRTQIEPLSCYVHREAVFRLARRLGAWLARNRLVSSITILHAWGAGRWAEDMQFLLDLFPRARFDFHTFEDCMAETEALASPRITMHPVESHYRYWFAETARSIVSRSKPLVLIHGPIKQAPIKEWQVRLLKASSIGCDTVIAPTMNHFILALRLASSHGPPSRDCPFHGHNP